MPQTVESWLKEIDAALKREKEWRGDALEALELYNGERTDQTPFNVFYSNTETLMPALYSAQPRPRVDRRFKDENPLGKAAATVGQRTLEFQVDTNSSDQESFDTVMLDAVIDALVPGRAVTRVRYDAEIVGAPGARVKGKEWVCFESVKFNRYAFGFARKWIDVPWFAFLHEVDQEEATKLFGATKAGKLQYTAPEKENTNDKENSQQQDEGDVTKEEIKTARVWEVFDRLGGKKVLWIGETFLDGVLKEEDDPLSLTGFFPVEKPLRFVYKSNNLIPTTLYKYYRNQAAELNILTRRIAKVTAAIKVRGVFDASLSEFSQVFDDDEEDNKLIPSDAADRIQDRSFEDSLWLVPVEKLVTTLSQLIVARQQCKQTIYEITGIADILRGSSQASETARAQEIKTQWGTLRLKRMQREVQMYARGLLRLALEIAAKKFSPATFVRVTGLAFPTQQEQAMAQQIAQAAQQVGQPPPPELAMKLSLPTWEAILTVLRDDIQRQYKIDIETNSTIDIEATEDKKDLAEIMNAMSQFLNGVAPLVQTGAMSIEAAKAMLLTIVRRYRFGADVEDQIKAMQAPKQEGGELEKIKLQQAQADFQHDQELKKMDMEMKREEFGLKRQELQGKAQYAAIMSKIKLREAEQKQALAERQMAMEALMPPKVEGTTNAPV